MAFILYVLEAPLLLRLRKCLFSVSRRLENIQGHAYLHVTFVTYVNATIISSWCACCSCSVCALKLCALIVRIIVVSLSLKEQNIICHVHGRCIQSSDKRPQGNLGLKWYNCNWNDSNRIATATVKNDHMILTKYQNWQVKKEHVWAMKPMSVVMRIWPFQLISSKYFDQDGRPSRHERESARVIYISFLTVAVAMRFESFQLQLYHFNPKFPCGLLSDDWIHLPCTWHIIFCSFKLRDTTMIRTIKAHSFKAHTLQ